MFLGLSPRIDSDPASSIVAHGQPRREMIIRHIALFLALELSSGVPAFNAVDAGEE
jgi:hypothetical protein